MAKGVYSSILSFLVILPFGVISCGHAAGSPLDKPAVGAIDPQAEAHREADIIRDPSDTLLDDPALTSVTRDFGATVIGAQNFPLTTPVKSVIAIADVKAWSSWWYPRKSRFLFDESAGRASSPLGKYDVLRSARTGRNSTAANYESNGYNPSALSWEGLCDAWAIASLSHSEPKHPVTFTEGRGSARTSVTFSIADLKALLLMTYEAVADTSFKYYGQKFTGNESGWIFPDIFPEQFHRFVEVQLFERKQAFIMDHDPGIEVWNVPVYKANYSMSPVPNKPDAVLVKMWLFSAESTQANEMSFVGTREAVREYDYILEGSRNANGDLLVETGHWVNNEGINSRSNHPDYLVQMPAPGTLVRKSWNPEMDIALVDEILAKSY